MVSLWLLGRQLDKDRLVDMRGAGALSADGGRVVSLGVGEVVVTHTLVGLYWINKGR